METAIFFVAGLDRPNQIDRAGEIGVLAQGGVGHEPGAVILMMEHSRQFHPRPSIALALVLLEAKPLRPHLLDLFIKPVHLLVAPIGSRFGCTVSTYLIERLFYRELFGIGHWIHSM
jgi:hypothetical protein